MATRVLNNLLGNSGTSGGDPANTGGGSGSGASGGDPATSGGGSTTPGGSISITESGNVFDMAPKEMLGEVNRAIYNILVGGQSYKIGSRSLTRADLSTLRSLRAELEAEMAAEEDDGLLARTYAAVFDRPR